MASGSGVGDLRPATGGSAPGRSDACRLVDVAADSLAVRGGGSQGESAHLITPSNGALVTAATRALSPRAIEYSTPA